MANKVSFSLLLIILSGVRSLGAQNVSRNQVTLVRNSPSSSLAITRSWNAKNEQHSVVRRHDHASQPVQKYYIMLQPKRLSMETKAYDGNLRLLSKRNDNSNSQLNSNGKIWELPESKQQPDYRLMQVSVNRSPSIAYESTVQGRETNGERTNDIIRGNVNSKCHKRSLSKMMTSAKSLLTSGMEQYASRGNLILGSSLLAAAIPLAVLVLPESRSNKQRADSTGDNSISSTFSIQARVDSVMGWIERSVEHLPNFPRLHPQECVKRSICEAHNDPERYGAIGFILRLFFPATNHSSTDRMDNMEYKVINKYRHAAGFGMNKRIDSNGTSSSACKEKYEDCLVSLLEIAQNLLDIFLKR